MTEVTRIHEQPVKEKESDLVYEVREVKRITRYSPNILAVVNFPENPNGVLTRGYVFNICFEEAYGNLETAVRHFTKRSVKLQGFVVHNEGKNEIRDPLLYLLGFVSGKNWGEKKEAESKGEIIDRDLIYFPFEKSGIEGRGKTNPFLVKSSNKDDPGTGYITTINPNEIEDIYPIVSNEIALRRMHPEKFKNFPDLENLGLAYIL